MASACFDGTPVAQAVGLTSISQSLLERRPAALICSSTSWTVARLARRLTGAAISFPQFPLWC